jgi:hypothetical protein
VLAKFGLANYDYCVATSVSAVYLQNGSGRSMRGPNDRLSNIEPLWFCTFLFGIW